MDGSLGVSLVCCDLAGTVIDGFVVERAFAEAIATQGIVPGTQDYVRAMVRLDRSRGRPPADVLREQFAVDEPRAQAATLAFDQSFRSAAERFGVALAADVSAAFAKVAAAGTRICLLTGLSRGAVGDLLGRVRGTDLALCGDEVPRGFPWPDPVITAMLRLGTEDAREVAVVSATEDGVLAGHRAGAGIVAGVSDDPRRSATLRDAGATHLIDAITALPELVAGLRP